MRIVLQRAEEASVTINNKVVADIKKGIALLVAVHKDDTEEAVRRLADKCISLRVFPDKEDRMNLSVKDIKGEILAVPQFTLYGRTKKGTRPDYHDSAEPGKANKLFELFLECLRQSGLKVASGVFKARMLVDIKNNGPVTLILEL
jgi:D-aminoacyl-tRNA deacylase